MRWNRSLLAALAAIATTPTGHGIVVAQCGPNGCVLPPTGQTPLQPAPPTTPSGVRGSLPSVARIVHREASGTSLGSGVLIASDGETSHFLTCAHLFEAAGRTTVWLGDQEVSAELIAIDKRHDLALLRTSRVEATPVSLGEISGRGPLTACGFGPTGQRR